MLSRRTFLKLTSAGSGALLTSAMFADEPVDNSVMPTRGKVIDRSLPTNPSVAGQYRLPHRFGMGCVAIGNGFAPTTDDLSQQTLEAAWNSGVRYFDTSPFYGYGLSERRLGRFLHNHKPDEYVLSTKVGRVFKATRQELPPSLWKSPSPFSFDIDYTAIGTRRSIEDSLQRLGVSSFDIVFIHDLSPDMLGDRWTEEFAIAAKGAMPELTRLREEGVIKAWGFGVNRTEPALRAAEVADPDLILLATQYSLLDHKAAIEETFPTLKKKSVPIVVGAPLLAGFLAGRDRYLYGGTVPDGAKEKRAKIVAVADDFGVDLRTASLQLAAAPSIVSAVIPGARTPQQVQANVESMKVAIPVEFWAALKQKRLIDERAPVPA